MSSPHAKARSQSLLVLRKETNPFLGFRTSRYQIQNRRQKNDPSCFQPGPSVSTRRGHRESGHTSAEVGTTTDRKPDLYTELMKLDDLRKRGFLRTPRVRTAEKEASGLFAVGIGVERGHLRSRRRFGDAHAQTPPEGGAHVTLTPLVSAIRLERAAARMHRAPAVWRRSTIEALRVEERGQFERLHIRGCKPLAVSLAAPTGCVVRCASAMNASSKRTRQHSASCTS